MAGEPCMVACEQGPSPGSGTTLKNELRQGTSLLWALVLLGQKEALDFDNHSIYVDRMFLIIN